MSNPFDYIKRERELKIEREQQEKQRKEADERMKITRFEEIYTQYRPIVDQVMQNLKEAAYPAHEDQIKCTNIPGEKLAWAIGRNRGKQDGEYWIGWVEVILEVDSSLNAKDFLCRRLDMPKELKGSVPTEIHASLTMDNLILAIQTLFPPGS